MSWVLGVLFHSHHTNRDEPHIFPTTVQEIQGLLAELGGDGTDYEIVDMDWTDDDENCNFAYFLSSFENLNELNYMAVKLSKLTQEERNLLDAALDHRGSECARQIMGVINLIENLDCFYLQPAYSEEDYGKLQLDMARDNFSPLIKQLEELSDPTGHEFVKYLDDLEKSVDKQRLGQAFSLDEKGSFTNHGYITQTSEIQEIYKGVEDIPEEYFVLEPQKYMRLENTDLSALLTKMHVLVGDCYYHDLEYNLNKLHSRASDHYMILMTKNSINITESAHVYRQGSDANEIWIGIPHNAEVRAFSLYVTDNQGAIIGDLTEISLYAQKNDIRNHGVYPSTITVSGRDGDERTFTVYQWYSMQPIEQDGYPNQIWHFEPDHLQAALRNLEERVSINRQNSYCVDERDFLSNLNDSYMAACENPQPDMLRLPKKVANDILQKTVAEVYQLLPDGPKKLTLMDAVKSSGLNYVNYCEFAVRKDALPELDTWAKRKTKELVKPQRDNPNRTKGPEL